MARTTNRLSARAVATSKAGAACRWRRALPVDFVRWLAAPLGVSLSLEGARQTGAGRLREMGLGSAARSASPRAGLAGEARAHLSEGRNPLAARGQAAIVPTFGPMADQVVSSLEIGWRNPKHRDQWRMTLSTYCEPIRGVPVDLITTEHVVGVLQPLWSKVPETASRLRGRIEKVLDAAKARGHRTGENPARWRGHLDHLLPKRQKLTRGHHKALPYQEVAGPRRPLAPERSVSALCLEFTILTAARSGEAMGARWSEFDLARGIWTVPKGRMKAGHEHRVPLPHRASAILQHDGTTTLSR